ncbi:MAG: hypothetical protein OEM38_08755 [Gammaproteobacteria bacterium]|nr:hypothetical protein [Gammaproteobacteria bacterium]
MKLLLIIIIAAAAYAALNWDMVSSKINAGIDEASELKQKGDDVHDNVQQKLDDAKKNMDDVKDTMDDTKDSFEKLIDKVK